MNSEKEKFEREFEAFLREDDSQIASLYRKLPKAEPDAKVDAAVLAMAQRALNPELVATPIAKSISRRPRWLPAVGLAAGVVLAASVALRVGPQIWNDHSAAVQTAARDNGVIQVRPVDAPLQPPAPASPPPPQALDKKAVTGDAVRRLDIAEQPSAAKPAPMRESLAEKEKLEAQTSTPPLASDSVQLGVNQTSMGANAKSANGAPQAFPGQQRAQPEMDALQRNQAAARGAWWPSHTDQSAGSEAKLAAKPGTAAADAAATVSSEGRLMAPASPPQSTPAPAAAVTEPAARVRSTSTTAIPGGVAADADKSLEAKRAEEQSSGYSDEVLRNSHLYPESWVAAIQKLQRTGRIHDAKQNLELFRKKYPNYRLPTELLDLK